MKDLKKSITESSFTLIETIIAISILSTLVLNSSGVTLNAIFFNQYSYNLLKAVWLGKSLMSQIEYDFATSDSFGAFKLKSVKEKKFEDNPNFSFDISIVPWNLNITDFLSNQGASEEDSPANSDMIGSLLKSKFKDGFFKIANVNVHWSNGAKKKTIKFSKILPNLIDAEKNLKEVENLINMAVNKKNEAKDSK